eukprot:tig00000123_g6931.t1
MDHRNVGGFDAILQEKLAHRTKMMGVRSIVDCGRPETYDILRAKQRPKSAMATVTRPKTGDEYTEVREAFRRVAAAKPAIQNYNPAAYGRAQALRDSRERKEARDREAHEAVLRNMQRRMQAYNSATEQKKNPYNTVYNPALILRRGPNSTAYTISAIPARPASSASQRPGTARSTSSLGSSRERPQSARRPSARDRDDALYGSYTGYGAPSASASSPLDNDAGAFGDSDLVVPRTVTTEAEMRSELKHALVSAIVAGRLYKSRALTALFERAAALNAAHIPYEIIQDVVLELKADLAIEN